MSFFLSGGLQAAVYGRLTAAAEVTTLVGEAIFDGPPNGAPGLLPPDYVILGEESVRPNDTKTSRGALHDFEVTVHSRRDGFERVKRIAGAICEALVDAPLAIEGGTLVALRFLRARATRGPAPEKRQVALRFRAVVDEN